MKKVLIPAKDLLTVALGPTSKPVKKVASALYPGDMIWCFVADTLSPLVTGHFEFIRLESASSIVELDSFKCSWFNQSDGPVVYVPKVWTFFGEGSTRNVSATRQHVAYSFPGTLYDDVPLGVDYELFSSVCKSTKLTESLAYFLGAFAVRPQCYEFDQDTWGIFGVRFNRSGEYGFTPVRNTEFTAWYTDHRDKVLALAADTWPPGSYFIEEKASPLGLPDRQPPHGHQADQYLKATAVPLGFSIHAKISSFGGLNSKGSPGDSAIRLIQYWYSCLESVLLERSTVSVRKSFLLGAFDTVSNADRTRKSIGLDWPDGFRGQFPFYSVVHGLGRELLPSFQGDETTNPRSDPTRDRGRIPRCSIVDEVQNIGFFSLLRFSRAIRYEPSLFGFPTPSFPTPNALSVIFGESIATVAKNANYGSDEAEFTDLKLYRTDQSAKVEFIECSIALDSAFPSCSLPLGTALGTVPTLPSSMAKKVRLAQSHWEAEALSKLENLNQHLPSVASAPPEDKIFEFLIALFISRFIGVREAWVVPRSEDQGIDGGASYDMGPTLGIVGVVFQAKLQNKAVGRRIVDQVRGSLFREDASIGYVITNNTFTTPAKNSAANDHPRVRLIDGPRLVRGLVLNKLGFHSAKSSGMDRIYIDLTFFERLRDVVVSSAGRAGKIRLCLDGSGNPMLVVP